MGIPFKSIPSTQIAIAHRVRGDVGPDEIEDCVRIARLQKSTVRSTPRTCYFLLYDGGVGTDHVHNDHIQFN